jgi:hypothetical protein
MRDVNHLRRDGCSTEPALFNHDAHMLVHGVRTSLSSL